MSRQEVRTHRSVPNLREDFSARRCSRLPQGVTKQILILIGRIRTPLTSQSGITGCSEPPDARSLQDEEVAKYQKKIRQKLGI